MGVSGAWHRFGVNTRLASNQIARRQHGLITLDQALAAGLTVDQVRHRHRSGEWSVARPGVYVMSGAPPTWVQTVAAVALASQPQAWISHETAGTLWALPGVRNEAIHVVTGLDRRVRLAGVRGHRSGGLFDADLTTIQRIPVTTPARSIVDVSARLTRRQLGLVLDDAVRRRVMSLESFRKCVTRLAEAPGRRMSVLQELLAERLPGYNPGDSDLESHVLRLLVARGYPPPAQQYKVRLGSRTFRIDLAYPVLRLAIELDGWEFHSSRSAFDDDRVRANLLVAHGWTVVRFTSRSSDEEILGCIGAFGHLGVA